MLYVGEKKIVGKFEVRCLYRIFTIRDLTNAGKRGKTVPCVSVEMVGAGSMNDAFYNLLRKVTEEKDFESAKNLILASSMGSGTISAKTYVENSYDVDPADMPEVVLQGESVTIRSSLRSFSVRDRKDVNESTLIARDKRGPRAFYKMVREQGEKLRGMSFSEVAYQMSLAGIKVHSYYAQD